MNMKKITIQDVHAGTLFCQPEYVYPYNALIEVVEIEYNEKYGQPIKDEWGLRCMGRNVHIY